MGRTVDRILSQIDLLEYMTSCGYTPYPLGNGSYYGLREHTSVRIYPETNTYFHPGSGNGNPHRLNVINFCEWYYGISNKEAIKLLAKELNDSPSFLKSKVNRDIPKTEKAEFKLPQKTDGNYKHIYAYLTKTRCISKSVVNDMVKRNFLYEDIRGNATFVSSYNGEADFCFQRGCSDKIPPGYSRAFTRIIPGSNFDHGWFVNNSSNKLFITEAVIDSMSVMTMFEMHGFNPNDYDYIATCGPSMKPIVNYISEHRNISTVYLGFDNDETGNKYRKRASAALKEAGYQGKIIDKPPHTKDFNEDLKFLSRSENAVFEQSSEKAINNILERTIQL